MTDTIAFHTTTIDGQPVTVPVPELIACLVPQDDWDEVPVTQQDAVLIGAIKRDLARRGWGWEEERNVLVKDAKHEAAVRITTLRPGEIRVWQEAPTLLGAWVAAYTEAVSDA